MLEIILKGLSIMGFSLPILTEIALLIDSVIYKVAALSLEAFFQIIRISDNLNINTEVIGPIISRIMILAGVFALFRVAIMLINYLIDPDKLKNASQTGTTFIKNFIIAVVLLVLLPTIFTELNRIEGIIIDSDVIPKLIYGVDNYNSGSADFVTFRYENDPKGENIAFQAQKFVNNVFLLFYDDEEVCNTSNAGDCGRYNAVRNASGTIKSLILNGNTFNYTAIFSSIMGCLLVYYFVSYAVEIAIRLVRLVVLEVIYPIPVIMSVDPSQKDRLRNYATTYITTWLQVFVRIFTVYIALVVCTFLANNVDALDTAALFPNMMLKINFFIKIIIYIGVFQAAKELPKLIDDVLGTKFASGAAKGKSFGTVLKGIVGAGTVAVGGGIAGGIAGYATGGAASAVAGAVMGAASGAVSGATSGAASKNVGSLIASSVKNIKSQYELGSRIGNSGGIVGYGIGKFDTLTGRGNKIDKDYNLAKRKVDTYANFENAVQKTYAAPTSKGGAGMTDVRHDPRVLAAEQNLNNYYRSSQYQTDTPAVRNTTIAGFNKAIKQAENDYKQDAFTWFQENKLYTGKGSNIDRTADIARDYNDSNKYPTLTEAEKAYYELTRENNGSNLLGSGNTTGTELQAEYKKQKADADTLLQTQEQRQKDDRYIHQRASEGSTKKNN